MCTVSVPKSVLKVSPCASLCELHDELRHRQLLKEETLHVHCLCSNICSQGLAMRKFVCV